MDSESGKAEAAAIAKSPGAEDTFELSDREAESEEKYPDVTGYKILGVLGRGGMGVVYRAQQIKLDRVVALKMVLAGAHAGPEQLTRFHTEAQAVAHLQHPNIIQAARMVETLAGAMHHAHVHGVVHRDLNPANVLLTAEILLRLAADSDSADYR